MSQVDATIIDQKRVQIPEKDPILADPILPFLAQIVVGQCDGAGPKGVVVGDHSSHPHQFQQQLVVMDVVLLVRVHKCEIKCAFFSLQSANSYHNQIEIIKLKLGYIED